MGNSNEVKAPSYSLWGILLGQYFKQKEYSQKCHERIVDEVTNKLNLEGKRYLVTGASSGIGKEVTKLLARRGGEVIMVSRSIDRLKQAADEIKQEIEQQHLNSPNLQ